MTEEQADRLFTLVSIQTGVTVGCFAALLVIMAVLIMGRRNGH